MTATQPAETTALDDAPIDHKDISFGDCPAGAHFAAFDDFRSKGDAFVGYSGDYRFLLLTRMNEIRDAYQDPTLFSSSAVTLDAPNPPYMWIPEMLDAPEHGKWRRLLGPIFSPAAIEALKPKVHQRFQEILDEIAPRGKCDYVADVSLRFPNTIFMEIMGLPVEQAEQFQDWETRILHVAGYGDDSLKAMHEVTQYFAGLLEERAAEPRDDILSKALQWEIDGEKVTQADLESFCLLLFMAGLDTVAAQLSYSMLHLAQNDADRARIVEEPALIPSAIEEFLRYYSFVTPSRKAMADTEIAGCPVKAGEMVHLPLAAANRDPAEFPDADKVIIDREDNRHLAFGAGPHRCLGSHLARQELFVGISEWHKRIPNYRLAVPLEEVREHGGQIGLNNLPLVWDV
jgi:cytochrome P450